MSAKESSCERDCEKKKERERERETLREGERDYFFYQNWVLNWENKVLMGAAEKKSSRFLLGFFSQKFSAFNLLFCG